MACRRFSQKPNNLFCFFALLSRNAWTWDFDFKFQVFQDCHGQKKSFVCFLGESMARQSAFGFIWPLYCRFNWFAKVAASQIMNWFYRLHFCQKYTFYICAALCSTTVGILHQHILWGDLCTDSCMNGDKKPIPHFREYFQLLNSFRTLVRKLFKFSLHKRNFNTETIWDFQGFKNPKKNSFRGNYSRKYGI